MNNFWRANLKSGWSFSSSWTFFLMSTHAWLVSVSRYDRIFRVRKDLGELLDRRVENSLLVIVVYQVYWIKSLKVPSPNHTLINTIRPGYFLIHLQWGWRLILCRLRSHRILRRWLYCGGFPVVLCLIHLLSVAHTHLLYSILISGGTTNGILFGVPYLKGSWQGSPS